MREEKLLMKIAKCYARKIIGEKGVGKMDNKNIVTYLFGAGASVEVLPVVKDLPDRLGQTSTYIHDQNKKIKDFKLPLKGFKPIHKINSYLLEIAELMEGLSKISRRHSSIDTYAKKLFIAREFKKLFDLKVILSIYMAIEQQFRGVDKRYDAFFATIIHSMDRFPENINILSWNYDNQFELSYSEFVNDKVINRLIDRLNITTKLIHNKQEYFRDIFPSLIHKINGSIDFYSESSSHVIPIFSEVEQRPEEEIMDIVARKYAYIKENADIKSAISFAWEGKDMIPILPGWIFNNVKETKILVSIGYSFPYFNRRIDRKIINHMEHLETIYIQAPDAVKIIDRVSGIVKGRGIKIIPILDTDYFYVPDELQ
jgi:hypothetical protein